MMALRATKIALLALSERLRRSREGPRDILRLTRTAPDAYDLKLDRPRKEDQILTHEGFSVVAFDSGVAKELEDALLDLDEDSEDFGWILLKSPCARRNRDPHPVAHGERRNRS
jgi:hypothetical protein